MTDHSETEARSGCAGTGPAGGQQVHAEVTDPDPPAPSRLRTAARTYQAAFRDLAHYAHLAA